MSQPLPQGINGEDEKTCWVCFATEDDDRDAKWVRPCRCRGTNRWVHQMCLQRWIDEKQRGNSTAKVLCPQCNTEYHIDFPKLGPIVYVMDLADRIIYKVCPFVAGGIFIGSMYWTAVTYGAVTVMQVLGHKEGLNVMEKADPLFLLIGLPTIPVILILGKMVRWEDFLLRLWRKHSSKLPLFKYLFGDSTQERVPSDTAAMSDPVSATRVLCGALILPTIATVVGKLMFGSVHSNFQRTLLGGIAFIAIKGVLKIYFKQQQYVRQAQRRILNFEDHVDVASGPGPVPGPNPEPAAAPDTGAGTPGAGAAHGSAAAGYGQPVGSASGIPTPQLGQSAPHYPRDPLPSTHHPPPAQTLPEVFPAAYQ